jgi:colanic acid/amylovoran biosynthesis protein
MKMNIRVSHISNTYNNGSFMMAINLLYHLAAKIPADTVFYTDTPNDNNMVRLRSALPKVNVVGRECDDKLFLNPNSGLKPIRMVKLYMNKLYQIIRDRANMHIVLGGDDLSEYYGTSYLVYGLLSIYLYSLKMPVYLVGQTVGPFTGWRKYIAYFVLKRCHIYTRETLNFNYLQEELGLSTVQESRDLAFLALPGQNDPTLQQDVANRYGLQPGQYITIVPSGLYAHYCKDQEAYVRNFVNVIHKLKADRVHGCYKIVLLAHVINTESDDRFIISKIMKLLGKEEKIVTIYDELMPNELRMILGNGYFTITGRMHAAVSTFQMGRPAISLAYSVKYKGVIASGLDMDGLVIDCSDPSRWEEDLVAEDIMSCVDYIDKDYIAMKNKIVAKVSESKNLAEKQITAIREELISPTALYPKAYVDEC